MSRDPYRYFRVEARELLGQMTESALALEKAAVGTDAFAGILRLAHTLKGAARVVKQREIAEQAHVIEDLLAPHREVAEPLSPTDVEAILRGIDIMRGHVARLEHASVDPIATAEARTLTAGGSGAVAAAAPAPPRVEEVDELLDALDAAGAECARLRAVVADLSQLKQRVGAVEHAWERARAQRSIAADAGVTLALSQVRESLAAQQRLLVDGAGHLGRELSEAQETTRRLRLRRAGDMFLALEIASRDAALALGRQVDFVALGKDERLDAKVFAVMQQALLQAVRNAVAHGVETDSQRTVVHKSPRATIRVEVIAQGRRTLFTCRDDGRGIDLVAVRAALVDKGMAAQRVASMTKAELLRALLTSRISTSASVTQLAGRGIGLDVIREAAALLDGTVVIHSEAGVGTDIEFSIPTSIAAVDALMVESGGRVVGIPLRAVQRTLRIADEELAHSPRGAALMLDGNVVPFVTLARALRQTPAARSPVKASTAVIVVQDGQLAAVGIDRLCGTQNLVVRPLPQIAACDAVVAGASLDSQGNPQLMLDPQRLVEFAAQAGVEPLAAAPEQLPVLVIDDSLTTRMLEQSILESAGYVVDVAVCAEDGLIRARSRRYALILVDVEMPGMDGFTFVEQVRADASLKDIPTILVTSRAAPEDRERGIKAGANGYIVKGNFDQGELLSSIRRLVRQS